jgi:hypothetical protein
VRSREEGINPISRLKMNDTEHESISEEASAIEPDYLIARSDPDPRRRNQPKLRQHFLNRSPLPQGTDHSGRASRRVPCRRGRSGSPAGRGSRSGYPRRRLDMTSKAGHVGIEFRSHGTPPGALGRSAKWEAWCDDGVCGKFYLRE